jgi:hypothetical protein
MLAQYGSLSKPAVPDLVHRLGSEKVKSRMRRDTALTLLQIDMEGTKGIALPVVVEEAIEIGRSDATADYSMKTNDYFLTDIARLDAVASETLKELNRQAPEMANRLRAKIEDERKHRSDHEAKGWNW